MKRIPTETTGFDGVWFLSDREMFTLSVYVYVAAKHFKKKKSKAMYQEAKQISEEIDSILKDTDFYKALTEALDNIELQYNKN